jgi:hypothetical protein
VRCDGAPNPLFQRDLGRLGLISSRREML